MLINKDIVYTESNFLWCRTKILNFNRGVVYNNLYFFNMNILPRFLLLIQYTIKNTWNSGRLYFHAYNSNGIIIQITYSKYNDSYKIK